MRVAAVHADVLVFISTIWQTTCTAVRADGEGFVIDSPVLPDELEALPNILGQAGFPVSGLLATHGDWDHLLGRLAFPDASLGCAESTVERLNRELGGAQRELRRFDDEHYIERPRPLALAAVQSLPVPGRLSIGSDDMVELELHPADGHTTDGTSFWMPSARVLVCGDYLSPVEIPTVSPGGSAAAYAATLKRLRPLVERADTIVPGHGGPLERSHALALLDEDAAYIDALVEQPGTASPPPRRGRGETQRAIHETNVERTAG